MKILPPIVLALALATLCVAVAHAAPFTDSSGRAIHDSRGHALGSVEARVDLGYARLTKDRLDVAAQLQRHKIDKAGAQRDEVFADRIRTLLDAAVSTCAQDKRTYECTGDETKAKGYIQTAMHYLNEVTPP